MINQQLLSLWNNNKCYSNFSLYTSSALFQSCAATPTLLLHINVPVSATTTSLSGTSPLQRCPPLVLGDFPTQTKPSSPLWLDPLCLSLHPPRLPNPTPTLPPHGFTPLSMPCVAPTHCHRNTRHLRQWAVYIHTNRHQQWWDGGWSPAEQRAGGEAVLKNQGGKNRAALAHTALKVNDPYSFIEWQLVM